ncbi:MAG: hypothetical protein QOI79_2812 [Mycobacterium sp.]|jgi:hypothetical protein|nr:hypothetical protein [Mycobacterium sp.]
MLSHVPSSRPARPASLVMQSQVPRGRTPMIPFSSSKSISSGPTGCERVHSHPDGGAAIVGAPGHYPDRAPGEGRADIRTEARRHQRAILGEGAPTRMESRTGRQWRHDDGTPASASSVRWSPGSRQEASAASNAGLRQGSTTLASWDHRRTVTAMATRPASISVLRRKAERFVSMPPSTTGQRSAPPPRCTGGRRRSYRFRIRRPADGCRALVTPARPPHALLPTPTNPRSRRWGPVRRSPSFF